MFVRMLFRIFDKKPFDYPAFSPTNRLPDDSDDDELLADAWIITKEDGEEKRSTKSEGNEKNFVIL